MISSQPQTKLDPCYSSLSLSLSFFLSLNISVAFDTLYHRPLLERSGELFGLEEVVLERLSKTAKVTTGVPQGSDFGQLIFSVFTTPVETLISTFVILAPVRRQYSTWHCDKVENKWRPRCSIQLCRRGRRLAHPERSHSKCIQNWGAGCRYTPTNCQTGPIRWYGGFRVHYTFRQEPASTLEWRWTIIWRSSTKIVTSVIRACNYHMRTHMIATGNNATRFISPTNRNITLHTGLSQCNLMVGFIINKRIQISMKS